MEITNRSAGKVYVYAAPGWKVNGADAKDGVLRALVGPGETIEDFLWFDHDDVNTSSPSSLKNVEGTIAVEDYDTSAILGEYRFTM